MSSSVFFYSSPFTSANFSSKPCHRKLKGKPRYWDKHNHKFHSFFPFENWYAYRWKKGKIKLPKCKDVKGNSRGNFIKKAWHHHISARNFPTNSLSPYSVGIECTKELKITWPIFFFLNSMQRELWVSRKWLCVWDEKILSV